MTETVKVVSDNPAHEGGYFIKNKSALTEDDVIFGQEAKAPTVEGDQFENMDADALRKYLVDNGQAPHHLAKEATLRAAARKLTSDLV